MVAVCPPPTAGTAEPSCGWDGEPLPLSALQHAAFCLRQAALIHLEQLWAENRYTAEGRLLHGVVDLPGQRRRAGVRRVTALPLSSLRLGLAGVADVVEFHRLPDGREMPYPVEYKRGRPKPHRADEIQLCAQALCLEDMTGEPVCEGALFYGESKRRVVVAVDEGLRALTLSLRDRLLDVLRRGQTPPAEWERKKCPNCSLLDLCQPGIGGQSVKAWMRQSLERVLQTPEAEA